MRGGVTTSTALGSVLESCTMRTKSLMVGDESTVPVVRCGQRWRIATASWEEG